MINNSMGKKMTKIASVIFIVGGVASLVYYVTAFLLVMREMVIQGVGEGGIGVAALVVFSNVVHIAAGIIMYKAGRKGFAAANVYDDYPIIYFWGKLMLVTVVMLCMLKGVYSTVAKRDAIAYAEFYILLLGLVIIYMYGGKLNSRLSNKGVEFNKVV